ncbi:hypothetical protein Mic7113_3126 [Allocoleopsis franciscana PCC 7113]|uniref:Transmembrane protein n=1 Tax=Allocoleopsis franciscana PCC 7113 TaxID=1173027 RepID=K9WH64_9CYAN|nr:hypothetical protein Mic7113_3126 [Allocoleopsis franciscana PCC 7113]
MRFRLGPVPTDPHFSPIEEGWNLVQTPNLLKLQFLSIPFIVLSFVFITGLVWIFLPIQIDQFSLIYFLLTFVLLIPVRAVIFVLLHPHQGRTSRSIVSFTLNQLMLVYVYYNCVLTRERVFLILLVPFLVLSTMATFAATGSQIRREWCISFPNRRRYKRYE